MRYYALAYAGVWVGSTAVLAVLLLVVQWSQMSDLVKDADFLRGLDMNVLCYTLLLCLSTFVLGSTRVVLEVMAEEAHKTSDTSCTWLIVSTRDEGYSVRITFPVEEFGVHLPTRDEFVQRVERWSEGLEEYFTHLARTYTVWEGEREIPLSGRVVLTLDADLPTRPLYVRELALAQDELKASGEMEDIVTFLKRFRLVCRKQGEDTIVCTWGGEDRYTIGGEGTLWLDDYPCVNVAHDPPARVRLVIQRVRMWPAARVGAWLRAEDKERQEKEEARRTAFKRARPPADLSQLTADMLLRHLKVRHAKDQPATHACVELIDDDETVETSASAAK